MDFIAWVSFLSVRLVIKCWRLFVRRAVRMDVVVRGIVLMLLLGIFDDMFVFVG